MFFLLGTLCQFPDTVLSNGIGDELLVLGHRRSDIGKSPIYGYANTLYLVWIWNGFVTPSYGIFVHTMGLVSALILLATHKTGKHVVDICWIQSGTPYINMFVCSLLISVVLPGSFSSFGYF